MKFDKAVARVMAGRSADLETDDRDLNQAMVEGRVHSVTTKGLFFTLPSDDYKHKYGPAPWPGMRLKTGTASAGTAHTHQTMANPVVGDRCLVVFLGTGIDSPWCLGVAPPT